VQVFESFSPGQRQELDGFLRAVERERYSASELAKIWRESGAEVWVKPADMSRFFGLLLKLLRGTREEHGELAESD
jgi:hypothetical protein